MASETRIDFAVTTTARQQVIPQATTGSRIVAIDALRGLALIVMALQHTSLFIQVNLTAESYNGQPPMLTTWSSWLTGLLTHVAAPTFWFLSGVSVALLVAARRRANESEWAITRFLLIRAGLIIVLDLTLGTLLWPDAKYYNTHVLLSIGVCLGLLSVLRLLPIKVFAALSIILIIAYQWLIKSMIGLLDQPQGLLTGLLLTNSLDFAHYPALEFPVMGWLGIMGLGFVVGFHLPQHAILRKPRTWFGVGAGLLLVWFILRLAGSFGDLGAYDPTQPWYYFFVMSKSPPSLTYQTFFLGLSAFGFAFFMKYAEWLQSGPGRLLMVIGQVSLFFFIVHAGVYRVLGAAVLQLNWPAPRLVQLFLTWLIGLAILVPLSFAYRRLRRSHPRSILRYL